MHIGPRQSPILRLKEPTPKTPENTKIEDDFESYNITCPYVPLSSLCLFCYNKFWFYAAEKKALQTWPRCSPILRERVKEVEAGCVGSD